MMKNYITTFFRSLLFFSFFFSIDLSAKVELPKLISDGMVLQRGVSLKIWGWANPTEKINIDFLKNIYETTADSSGNWLIEFPAFRAGGPYRMQVNDIEINNIMIGDVWLCSGQSNMEYSFSRLKDRYASEVSNCANSNIRQFIVPDDYNFSKPMEDYKDGMWKAVNSETILDFSAVAYFFAKELNKKYQVPIGIINAALGGSPIEAWMSADALKQFPEDLAEVEKYANEVFVNELVKSELAAIDKWYSILNETDRGLNSSPNWKRPEYDDASWPSIHVPGYWTDQGLEFGNGAIWFRREIDVPPSMIDKTVRLLMGRIVDADSVFINGICVGTTSYQYPQRDYEIPSGVLFAGKNTIAVRLISNAGRGGFVNNKPYKLFADTDTVCLVGRWKVQQGCRMSPTPNRTFVQWKPTGLYNAMIAPLNNYQIKGVAWYQGESNTGNPQKYGKLLPVMIKDWRAKRGDYSIPFIVAQLPNYMEEKMLPSESDWAFFRYEQYRAVKSVELAAISVNIDLGEANDIHPQNKEDVGNRMALVAQKLAYNNSNLIAFGPVYHSMKIKRKRIELTFINHGGGLIVKGGGELKHFAIAGEDNKFIWAKAVIKGNKVVVWCDAVKYPVSVRYAWADNPEKANLFNKEGLPAAPFTTER